MNQTSFSQPTPEGLVAVACPGCAATVAVDTGLLGAAAECPLCAAGFRLPAAPPPARRSVEPRSRTPAAPVSDRPTDAREYGGRGAEPLRPAGVAGVGPDTGAPPAARTADDETAALKRTSAERAARRTRRNAAMLVVGTSILLGIVMLLGRGRQR